MTTDAAYKPHGKSKLTLDRAMGYIQAVPYRVTLRWLFYRLLQDGTYSSKQDYGQLKPLTCLLYTSPSPRDGLLSRMPSSA